MAQRVRDSRLETRSSRLRLAIRGKPFPLYGRRWIKHVLETSDHPAETARNIAPPAVYLRRRPRRSFLSSPAEAAPGSGFRTASGGRPLMSRDAI